MPLLRGDGPRSNDGRADFFDAPTNPMRAMNDEWQASVEKMSGLRFVGYAWDAILVLVVGSYVRYVLTDPYGLGSSFEGVFITVGGFVFVALILLFLLRPVGRAAILRAVAVIRFIVRMLLSLFGSRREPKE